MVQCEKCGYGEITRYIDGCRWQCDYCNRIYEVAISLVQFGDCDDGKIGEVAHDSLHPAQFKESEPEVILPFHCTHCGDDVSDVHCYALGKNMTPEKCRGCPQLCQGMDYGEEWVGCHANQKHEGMIHG